MIAFLLANLSFNTSLKIYVYEIIVVYFAIILIIHNIYYEEVYSNSFIFVMFVCLHFKFNM